jgi:hypothetical protein
MAETLRFQWKIVSKPLKSNDPICRAPKYRIWIGGSVTHLTHKLIGIAGFSYAFCSWKNIGMW